MIAGMELRHVLPVLALGASIAASCGSEGAPTSTFAADTGGAGGLGGGTGASGTGASGATGTTSSLSASTSSSSSSSSSSASSSSSGSSSSSSSSSGGPSCDYTSPNACTGALQLADIDGDDNSDVRTATGTTSKWFKVLVVDTLTPFACDPVSFTATLDSPPGMDFDLYVYQGDASLPSCVVGPAHATGDPDTLAVDWNDGNGNDNRWYAIEVRYVSGEACGAEAQWTLQVKGHTAPCP